MGEPAFITKVFGHDQEINEFNLALKAGQCHHAWLLNGRKGIGKAAVSHIMAYNLLSDNVVSEVNADDDCWRKICVGSHPDLYVIKSEEGEDIKIDAVRELSEFTALTSMLSKRKVIIIDAADSLNRNAANALLKKLEEPTPNTYYLLICNAISTLPPTIRSRCRLLNFKPLSLDDFTLALSNVSKNAKDIANDLYQLTDGSLSLAQNFLDEDNFDLYKELEGVFLADEIDMNRAIAFSKKVTADNWDFISMLLERFMLDLFKAKPSKYQEVNASVELLRKAEVFHLDRQAMFLTIYYRIRS